jgi:hypothetical protein
MAGLAKVEHGEFPRGRHRQETCVVIAFAAWLAPPIGVQLASNSFSRRLQAVTTVHFTSAFFFLRWCVLRTPYSGNLSEFALSSYAVDICPRKKKERTDNDGPWTRILRRGVSGGC